MNGFYVNAMGDDDEARLASSYGENYPRIQQRKRNYDPTNHFRLNANIVPA